MKLEDVPVGDQRPFVRRLQLGQRATRNSNPERTEQHVLDGRTDVVRHAFVQRTPLLVEQPPERRLVAGKRPVAATNALPRLAEVDVDPHGEGALAQQPARSRREHGTSAECDHRGLRRGEHLCGELLLHAAELRLAPFEELPDRAVPLLDLTIEVDERPSTETRGLFPDRRLPRPHEADEREVPLERAYLGDQTIRSRYARCAETKSASASPPNFSRAALA